MSKIIFIAVLAILGTISAFAEEEFLDENEESEVVIRDRRDSGTGSSNACTSDIIKNASNCCIVNNAKMLDIISEETKVKCRIQEKQARKFLKAAKKAARRKAAGADADSARAKRQATSEVSNTPPRPRLSREQRYAYCVLAEENLVTDGKLNTEEVKRRFEAKLNDPTWKKAVGPAVDECKARSDAYRASASASTSQKEEYPGKTLSCVRQKILLACPTQAKDDKCMSAYKSLHECDPLAKLSPAQRMTRKSSRRSRKDGPRKGSAKPAEAAEAAKPSA